MKKVYDNAMVAHIWANQSQSEARSHNRHFWFRDKSIYSYSTEIARLVENVKGEQIALVTSHSYSMTTSGKHMPAIRRALRQGVTAYSVPAFEYHEANIKHWLTEYTNLKASCLRVKYRYDGRYDKTEGLHRIATTIASYTNDFGLTVDHPNFDNDLIEIDAAHAKRNTPDAIAKREKAQAKRNAIRAKEEWEKQLHSGIRRLFEGCSEEATYRLWKLNPVNSPLPHQYCFAHDDPRRAEVQAAYQVLDDKKQEEKLADWLQGKQVFNLYTQGAAYLRIRDSNLETSQGATVPLDHATRAFRFIRAVRASQRPWARNGHCVRVGHFQIDSIDGEGNIRAGCHNIQWSEIERIANQIGLFYLPELEDVELVSKARGEHDARAA
jgi:hypothetical protein